jgi:hypothetical protein
MTKPVSSHVLTVIGDAGVVRPTHVMRMSGPRERVRLGVCGMMIRCLHGKSRCCSG